MLINAFKLIQKEVADIKDHAANFLLATATVNNLGGFAQPAFCGNTIGFDQFNKGKP